MIDPGWVDVAKNLSAASVPTLLIIIIYGGYKQYWVWGYQMRDMTNDRNFWRDMALATTELAKRKVKVETSEVNL